MLPIPPRPPVGRSTNRRIRTAPVSSESAKLRSPVGWRRLRDPSVQLHPPPSSGTNHLPESPKPSQVGRVWNAVNRTPQSTDSRRQTFAHPGIRRAVTRRTSGVAEGATRSLPGYPPQCDGLPSSGTLLHADWTQGTQGTQERNQLFAMSRRSSQVRGSLFEPPECGLPSRCCNILGWREDTSQWADPGRRNNNTSSPAFFSPGTARKSRTGGLVC